MNCVKIDCESFEVCTKGTNLVQSCSHMFPNLYKKKGVTKKKYWKWSVKNDQGYKDLKYYYDDKGVSDIGKRFLVDWNAVVKIKHENIFIEV